MVHKFTENFKSNVHSQNGEDGLLREILSRLHMKTGHAVEAGANDGDHLSNTANLLKQGWSGFMIEADEGLYQKCAARWSAYPDVKSYHERLGPHNINRFVGDCCDVLSLDTDSSNDYDCFEAMTARPKVVIIEINSSIQPWEDGGKTSYRVMVSLAMAKDYFLLCHVGNLIFIRNDFRSYFPEAKYDPLSDSDRYFKTDWLLKRGHCTMLAIGNYGRFMNQGYQIASIIGIAARNGLEPVFRRWMNLDHRDRFGSGEDVDLMKYFVNRLPSVPPDVQWNPERPVEWGYHDVRLGPGNWNLSGHFQSTRYFAHCLDTVKHYFRMVDEPPLNDYCAIHVRLGDYDDAYHPRLDLRYYLPAIELMARDRETQKFLVFSDDIPTVREMFGKLAFRRGVTIEYSEGRDYIQDFKLMKRCRDFIIGNSTYSSMPAVLGDAPDKRVIAPRPWFGPKYTVITGEDIYEDDWTVINWK